MTQKTPSPAYLEQAKLLSREDAERVFSRMRKKLSLNLQHEKLDPVDAVALQLELEDDQLKAWRENLADLRKGKPAKD